MLSPPHIPFPQVLKTLKEMMMVLTVIMAADIYWTSGCMLGTLGYSTRAITFTSWITSVRHVMSLSSYYSWGNSSGGISPQPDFGALTLSSVPKNNFKQTFPRFWSYFSDFWSFCFIELFGFFVYLHFQVLHIHLMYLCMKIVLFFNSKHLFLREVVSSLNNEY